MKEIKKVKRIYTCGSVDDGKSTLIGRLLHDTSSLYQDQLLTVKDLSTKRGFEGIDFSLFTDGLVDERNLGITIDVAYRYFSTQKTKFIVADTPGHIQYTRNMITGSSDADISIILIDVNKGFNEQVLRHSFITSLFKVPFVIFCVNKMDLVNYDKNIFYNIKATFESLKEKIQIDNFHFIPISALRGDNIVNKLSNLSWHEGPTLMELLEDSTKVKKNQKVESTRFSIQGIVKNQNEGIIQRGFYGQLLSGNIKKSEKISILPSKIKTSIKEIFTINGTVVSELANYQPGLLVFEDDVDISRGDLISTIEEIPNETESIQATICCFENIKSTNFKKYILRIHAAEYLCLIFKIDFKYANGFSQKVQDISALEKNDISQITLKLAKPIFVDKYAYNKLNGRFILIDPTTSATIACGIIL